MEVIVIEDSSEDELSKSKEKRISNFVDLSQNDEKENLPNHIMKNEAKRPRIQTNVEISTNEDNILESKEVEKLEENIPHYYLENFYLIVNTVLMEHTHLFLESELLVVENFRKLSDPEQRLYVRLFQRKGPWFRVDDLKYSPQEIPKLKECAQMLELKGFVESLQISNNNLEEACGQLSVRELKEMAKSVGLRSCKYSPRREELIQYVIQSKGQRTIHGQNLVFQKLVALIGHSIKLSKDSVMIFKRMEYLFFLNEHSGQNLLLLADMKMISYPKYTIKKSHPLFPTRMDFLSYEYVIKLESHFNELIQLEEYQIALQLLNTATKWLLSVIVEERDPFKKIGHTECMAKSFNQVKEFFPEIQETLLKSMTSDEVDLLVSTKPYLARFSIAWVFARLASHGLEILEKLRMYDRAILVIRILLSTSLCPGRRGRWWNRLVINLEHMGRKNDSLILSEEALNDSHLITAWRLSIQRRILRLARPPRRWKTPVFPDFVTKQPQEITITGTLLNSKSGLKSKFMGQQGPCSVEQYVLQYYLNEEGLEGIHTEGEIWKILFALLMWNVLFADVPDVFQIPFQDAPLDLVTDAFYTNRVSLIEEKLHQISTTVPVESLIDETWAYYGTQCRGLYWDRFTKDQLKELAGCIGGKVLAGVCKVLAEDYQSWSSGLPDLLLWKSTTRTSKVVEVKGPRDRLSDKQQAWIDHFIMLGMEVQICHVKES